MRARPGPFLILLLSFASFAQDANQQPLPSAPSAEKYPAKQTQPGPPQDQSAPLPQNESQAPATSQAPASQAPSTPSPTPSNGQNAPAPSPAPPAASQPPAQNSEPDEQLTTIVKQVDEVNVIFTVTD